MAVVLASATAAFAQQPQMRETTVRQNVAYGNHDGTSLVGDLYAPKAPGKYPVVIAVHGGGWQGGSKNGYRTWGPYLAARGIALYSIDYRLSKPGQPSYPQAVYDVRAAIQFVKQKGAEFSLDPERIALMGDSAGAHLVSLVGLSGDAAPFNKAYPNDPYASLSTKVSAVVSAYGIYDMVQQWNHDQLTRPRDQITEKFLGKPPMEDRRIYFESSPMSYAVKGDKQPAYFLTWGTMDDIVDPVQSEAFLLALKQAQIQAQARPIIGAVHAWIGEPLDDPRSTVSAVLSAIVRFLEGRLSPAQ